MTGDLFRAWVAQHLAPVLRPGDIVVMDNVLQVRPSRGG
jgi:transposase